MHLSDITETSRGPQSKRNSIRSTEREGAQRLARGDIMDLSVPWRSQVEAWRRRYVNHQFLGSSQLALRPCGDPISHVYRDMVEQTTYQ